MVGYQFGLKSEPEAKLQLPHAVGCVGRGIGFDGCDPTSAAAVNTGVALRLAEAQHGVIEHVVSVKAELCPVLFSD